MDKRQLHHIYTRLRPIRPWYFLVAGAVSGTVSIIALRDNNLHMVKLRTAVYSADQQDKNVQGALNTLQAYVVSHMNTDLSSGNTAVYPPIQLKYTYDRLVQAAGAQASTANLQLYNDAQTYCQAQDPTDFSGHNRVPCVQAYVLSHGTQTGQAIPDSLYKFDFISPRWSPDLAGWSLVITALCLLAFALTLITKWWLRRRSR
jgi:hypothetical protein